MKSVAKKLEKWKWPYLRTNSGGEREYACPHGAGHGGIHGCDGCCSHPSFLRAKENKPIFKGLSIEADLLARMRAVQKMYEAGKCSKCGEYVAHFCNFLPKRT